MMTETFSYFISEGYRKLPSASILNPYSRRGDSNNLEDTLFIVAGVQALNPIFIDEAPVTEGALFIAQPVIRTQYADMVGKIDGFSTSFVNICTEDLNASPKRHVEHIDRWLSYLSHIGLFVNQTSIVPEFLTPDWGKGTFNNVAIYLNYGGLQLGDMSFFYGIPQRTRKEMTVSDIGFGLERVAWAVNKSTSYFDAIGPFIESFLEKYRLMDSARTLALISGSGVTPSKEGTGYRFRKFAQMLLDADKGDFGFLHLIPYYHSFWGNLLQLSRNSDECRNLIYREYLRRLNAQLSAALRIEWQNSWSDTEALLESILTGSYGISVDQLRGVIASVLREEKERSAGNNL